MIIESHLWQIFDSKTILQEKLKLVWCSFMLTIHTYENIEHNFKIFLLKAIWPLKLKLEGKHS